MRCFFFCYRTKPSDWGSYSSWCRSTFCWVSFQRRFPSTSGSTS